LAQRIARFSDEPNQKNERPLFCLMEILARSAKAALVSIKKPASPGCKISFFDNY